MKKYEKYAKSMNEYNNYMELLNKRIEEFEKEVIEKEKKVARLQEDFTQNFIEGKETNSREMKRLQNDIAADKEQLAFIKDARNEDTKIKRLAKEMKLEYLELRREIESDFNKNKQEVENLIEKQKEEVEELRAEQKERMNLVSRKYIAPRLNGVEHMDIKGGQLFRLKEDSKGLYR